MGVRPYLVLTAIVFSLVALAHLLRVLFGWSAVIAGWQVPMWPSWLVLVGIVLYATKLLRCPR